MSYFPSLHDLLKKIEIKMEEQIDIINKHHEANINIVKFNSSKLKEHCTDGLDELKYQIDIENMLKDEGVFLHFDYKVKELSTQKQRIYDDTAKLEKIVKSFSYAKIKMENIYNEIKTFLQKMLSSTVFDEIKSKSTDMSINEISKESVLSKLLSEFKKKNGKLISAAKPLKEGNLFSSIVNSAMFNNIQNTEPKSANTTTFNNIVSTTNKEKTKAFTSDNAIQLSHTKQKPEERIYIIKVSEGDNKLVVYKDNDENGDINDRHISFNQLTHGCSHFLKNSAFVNSGKKIYISGGESSNGHGSNIFLCYDPSAHQLLRLEDMPINKYNHSLLYTGDFIFSVGGFASNTVEKYDISQNKWTKLPSLKSDERQKPILYLYGQWLYAFFGYRKGAYLDSIERFNIKSAKGKWENVMYSNPEKISCGMTGAACIQTDNNSIFMLGGKDSSSIKSSALSFDFESNKISLCDFKLEEDGHFKESQFIRLQSGDNALFNDNANQLLKLNLS